MILLKLLPILLLFFGLSAKVFASSAVLVGAGNQELRDDLQWLADRGVLDISTSVWPLPLSVIENALHERKKEGLSRGDVHALLNIKRFLEKENSDSYGAFFGLNSSAMPTIGFASQSRAKASTGVYAQKSGEGYAARVQANILLSPTTDKQSTQSLEGSYAAGILSGQLIYAGQLNHWWGPGTDGSLAWSNAATAIPGIGIRRATEKRPKGSWFGWVGPWGYDLFIGQMQHDTAVPKPNVLNLRLYARPLPGLELGVSRFVQWGGRGRPNGFSALWNAITGNSNDLGSAADPSNELAGGDIRYTFPLSGNPLTVYAQLMGEDEAGGMPSKYLAQLGMQYKYMSGTSRIQWHAEASDTTAQRLFGIREGAYRVAYAHSTYLNGLYHDGLPIGHFIGGSGQAYTVGVSVVPADYKYYSRYSAKIIAAKVNTFNEKINMAFPQPGSFVGGEFAVSWVLKPMTMRAAVAAFQGGARPTTLGVMLSVDVPLGKW